MHGWRGRTAFRIELNSALFGHRRYRACVDMACRRETCQQAKVPLAAYTKY